MIFCGCVIFGCAPAPFTFYLSELKNKREHGDIYGEDEERGGKTISINLMS